MATPKPTKPAEPRSAPSQTEPAPAPEKAPAAAAPPEPKEVGGVWTTAQEGVYSATKGGPPDPTVQPQTQEESA